MLDHIMQFFNSKFDRENNLISLNIVTVNSSGIVDTYAGLTTASIEDVLNGVTQNRYQ